MHSFVKIQYLLRLKKSRSNSLSWIWVRISSINSVCLGFLGLGTHIEALFAKWNRHPKLYLSYLFPTPGFYVSLRSTSCAALRYSACMHPGKLGWPLVRQANQGSTIRSRENAPCTRCSTRLPSRRQTTEQAWACLHIYTHHPSFSSTSLILSLIPITPNRPSTNSSIENDQLSRLPGPKSRRYMNIGRVGRFHDNHDKPKGCFLEAWINRRLAAFRKLGGMRKPSPHSANTLSQRIGVRERLASLRPRKSPHLTGNQSSRPLPRSQISDMLFYTVPSHPR